MKFLQEIEKIISPYMKSRGFTHSGKNYYYIANDIAYCIALDAPSSVLYVTYYVMPLYVPCETRYYTYGDRIHMIKGVDLPPLRKDVDYRKKEEWCGILCKCIEEKILPFYRQIETPELLAKYVENKAFFSSCYFSCPELFLSRLNVFNYLYLDDPEKICRALTQYRKMLLANTFLTDTVRRIYLEESDKIESLIHDDEKKSIHYIASIITNTRKKL